MKLDACGDGQPQHVDEEPSRALHVRHRQRDRPRDRRDLRPGTRPVRGLSRILLHQLDQDAIAIPDTRAAVTGRADRLGERRRAAVAGAFEIDRERHRRVADVGGTPVGRQSPHQRAAELEQLDLE
ncbi:MAG: hypothetical protein E6G49_04620 [Actinobacteria bacterium]|nr:MAG: hypothetical protein E6G49_04620 [Actinomycetota bacterium]